MDLAPRGRASTAGAAAVASGDGAAQPIGDDAAGASDVEWLARAAEDDGYDAGVAAEQPQLLG
ncbi:hypothetical protein ACFQV8_21105 [Pseudonocardia benzenivorans]